MNELDLIRKKINILIDEYSAIKFKENKVYYVSHGIINFNLIKMMQ
jgi:hypothetical protein